MVMMKVVAVLPVRWGGNTLLSIALLLHSLRCACSARFTHAHLCSHPRVRTACAVCEQRVRQRTRAHDTRIFEPLKPCSAFRSTLYLQLSQKVEVMLVLWYNLLVARAAREA